MTLNKLWSDESALRAVFSWLSRIGAAPKFGSRPIGWYQQCQCESIDKLTAKMAANGFTLSDTQLKTRKGYVFARNATRAWTQIASVSDISAN